MSASLGRRIRAGVIDLGLALAWAAVVVGAGFGLRSAGLLTLAPLALNLIGGTLIVVPIVLFFSLAEGSRYRPAPASSGRACGCAGWTAVRWAVPAPCCATS